MSMRRLSITFLLVALLAGSAWAGETDEVIVTRQLTMSQRNALPENTVTMEIKRLSPAKKADPELLAAINTVMDTVANEDYMNRTFVLLIEPKPANEVSIAVNSDDILTRYRGKDCVYGDLQRGRCHFVVLIGKDNLPLLEQTFKRQGKVKYVQEFEIVEFKTPYYPTCVIGRWSAAKGLQLSTVLINDDPYADRESFDAPADAHSPSN